MMSQDRMDSHRKSRTGWVACDYTTGDRLARLAEVTHGPIRKTATEASMDVRGPDHGDYDGVRFVAADGYLYVENPADELENWD